MTSLAGFVDETSVFNSVNKFHKYHLTVCCFFDGENSVGCSENNFLVEVKKILKESKNSDQKKVFFKCHCFKNMKDFEYLYDFFRRKYRIFSAEKCHHYKNEIL